LVLWSVFDETIISKSRLSKNNYFQAFTLKNNVDVVMTPVILDRFSGWFAHCPFEGKYGLADTHTGSPKTR
jgi:hypothetical protein